MGAIGQEFTEKLLTDADITLGQRVLDIGCGMGDVSLIAAGLVGPCGAVVGVDSAAGPLKRARKRAQEMGLRNVQFVQGDLNELPLDMGDFDVITGRRVLMYQPDAVATLRALCQSLRPGGFVVLHEHDMTMVPSSLIPLPLHQQVQGWLLQMLQAEGADTQMGFHLHDVLSRAGLTVDHVRAEAIVQTPGQPYALFPIIRAAMPRMLAHNITTEAELDIETMEQRLADERHASDATYIGDMMFGAWARKP